LIIKRLEQIVERFSGMEEGKRRLIREGLIIQRVEQIAEGLSGMEESKRRLRREERE